MHNEKLHPQVSLRAKNKKSIIRGHTKISIYNYLEGQKTPKVLFEDMKVLLEDVF